MTDKILTIGRQYGSGGMQVGYEVAKHFGIECYHRQIIQMAAESGEVDLKTLRAVDEKRIKEAPYSGIAYTDDIGNMNRRLFDLQSDIIRKLAADGPCVFVGRCANFVLKDLPNVYSVFIRADMDDRIDRIISMGFMQEKQAIKTIKRMDKERNMYYSYFTDSNWGEQDGYDMILNISTLGKDKCVDILCNLMEL